ncbi:NUDIX hydrolase [Saccharopolyspora sp. 5N708]|uniref:NUDIX hydrolase n=1 Tax=Saccharopolyspora sp. 5N708 TaxID=3457424 RepID=UPI003FD6789C
MAVFEDRYVAHSWVERNGKLLLLRRRVGRYLGGRWDIPGGTVEPGEQPEDAAVRETLEEARLRVAITSQLSHYTNVDTEGRPLRFHTLTYRVVEQNHSDVVLSEPEHDKHVWLSLEEAASLPLVWHVQATAQSILQQEL